MRNFFPRVLLGLLLAALVVSFTACRNTGYGDFDYVYPAELGSGIIRGMITRTPGLSIRAAAPVPVAGAEVWLEEFPSLRCLSDAQGNYRIIGVPAGTFRVVAKYNDNVTVYKMRSTSNTLVEKDEKVVDLGILTATNIVRGIMTDENGTVLPQGTPVYLWGEVFYIGQNGSFVTPPLPTFEGLNSIFDLVVNPGQSNQFNIPVSFVSADRPLEVVIAVPTSGSTSASAMPTVLLVAMKDNAIRTTASPNEQLTLTGVITPADTSNDNLVWSATRGTFGNDIQTDGGKRIRTWTAPDTDGIATLSLRITAANGKIATASLPILVGANVSYTVTYNGNGNTGGSVPVDGSTYANGANITVLGNTGNLVKAGFTFAGWNTKADGTGTSYAAASQFQMGAANVILYAQWTATTFSTTYNGNGHTSGTVPTDNAAYDTGDTVTVLGNTGNLGKTGYTFTGWNTKADGTGTDHAAASTFAMGNANVTLYAAWATNSYTVTYDGNGNTGGSVPVDGNSPHEYSTSVTALGNTGTLVKAGSVFVGWNTKADGTGTHYSPGNSFSMGGENLTLYAMWDSANFTLDQATPFSVRVNLAEELAASGLQFKIVKAAAAASIDTYAEAEAITGSDVLLDWTSGIATASVWLHSNSTTCMNVIAKGGTIQVCYTPQSQTTPEVHFPNILGMPTGDLLVVYKDASDGNKGKTLLYDKNGNYKTGPTTVVNALNSGWDDYFDLIPLSAGGAAMGFLDSGDNDIGIPNYIKLDTSGAAVGSKQAMSASNKTYLGPDIAEAGGKLFSFYSSDDNTPAVQGSRYSIYTVADNSSIVDNNLLNAGGGNVECRGVAVSAIGADRFFVIDSRGWNTLVPRYRIFNSDGTVAKAETAFATTKTETFNPTRLGNGNVLVPYKDLNDVNKGKIAVYNDAGDVVVGATVFANTNVASWRLPTALTDAGDVFIAYTDSSDAFKSKYAIVQADGTVSVSATTLDGGIAYPLGVTNVATENKLAIVYKHKDDTSYWLGFLNGL